jgi:hypothetical protein
MDRIKKTALELEHMIRRLASDLKDVQFQVHTVKASGGWSASAVVGTGNIKTVNARLKQFVDKLVILYELRPD